APPASSTLSLHDALPILACIWEIHQTVNPLDFSKPTYKNVSSVLHQLDVHPMAGAHFFKRRLTEHSYAADPFVRACRAIDQMRRSEEHTSELQSRENLVC